MSFHVLSELFILKQGHEGVLEADMPTYRQTITPSGNLASLVCLTCRHWSVGGNWSTCWKPMQTLIECANTGPCCCEVKVLAKGSWMA